MNDVSEMEGREFNDIINLDGVEPMASLLRGHNKFPNCEQPRGNIQFSDENDKQFVNPNQFMTLKQQREEEISIAPLNLNKKIPLAVVIAEPEVQVGRKTTEEKIGENRARSKERKKERKK